jgi:hypothetical protein
LGIALSEKDLRRITNLAQAVTGHFKYSNFIGATEAIFYTTQEPKLVEAIPFKIQHNINDMFEHTGTGNCPLFGHVTNQDNGNSGLLRQLH